MTQREMKFPEYLGEDGPTVYLPLVRCNVCQVAQQTNSRVRRQRFLDMHTMCEERYRQMSIFEIL